MPLATVNISTPNGTTELQFERGQSILILGANGGGKTRLGVHLDTELNRRSHRIAAQRALQFSASVQLVDFDIAMEKLQYGTSRSVHTHLEGDLLFNQKQHNRFGNKPATFLLSDYEMLLQALFGE